MRQMTNKRKAEVDAEYRRESMKVRSTRRCMAAAMRVCAMRVCVRAHVWACVCM